MPPLQPIVVNLLVLRLPLKPVDDGLLPFSPSTVQAMRLASNDKNGLDAFFKRLQERRTALLHLLEQASATEEEVDRALTQYLSLLDYLRIQDSTPEHMMSPLQNAFTFSWKNVICSSSTARVKSLEYEKVYVLLSAALWKSHHGATQLVFTETGLSAVATAKPFQLYRKSIGMLEVCEQILQKQDPVQSPIAEESDARLVAVQALKSLLLAEIQGMTVLRSIEKENAPTLISSLALDAKQKYEQCKEYSSQSHLVGNFIGKIFAYASYKARCYESYALTYFAWAKLSASAGGQAVRLSQEAEAVFQRASEQGDAYDNTYRQSDPTERESFHRSLEKEVNKARKQSESDNRHVYYDKIPLDLPELPLPKQLVGGIAYTSPDLDASIDRRIFADLTCAPGSAETVVEIISRSGMKAGSQNGKDDQEATNKQKKGKPTSQWWKWLLFIIAMPLLLLLTLLGIIIWIILIPLTFFCWPIGKLAHLTWRVVEYLIKAPLRAMLWASGKEWKAKDPHQQR